MAWVERFNVGAYVIDEAQQAKAALLDRFASKRWAARATPAALPALLLAFWREYGAIQHPKKRFVRYAFPGCSDLLGQLIDGRLLAVEAKRPAGRPAGSRAGPQQLEFLQCVEQHGGVAILADSVEGVVEAFARLEIPRPRGGVEPRRRFRVTAGSPGVGRDVPGGGGSVLEEARRRG